MFVNKSSIVCVCRMDQLLLTAIILLSVVMCKVFHNNKSI